MTPTPPILEVFTCPPTGTDPSEPVLTLERDSMGIWWHVLGGTPKPVVLRRATTWETLLPSAPRAWARLRDELIRGSVVQ